MVRVVERECLDDVGVPNGDDTFWLERGKCYTTTAYEDDGKVFVFTRYWFWLDAKHFGPAIPLGSTGGTDE